MALLFGNSAGQWAAVNQWIITAVALALVPVSPYIALSVAVWQLIILAGTFINLYLSRRRGFKNITIRRGSAFLVNRKGLKGAGQCIKGRVIEVHTWTYTSYRNRGGIDQYLKDLTGDAALLAGLVREGKVYCDFITCNSFNRHLLDVLEAAFAGREARRSRGVLLKCNLKLYRGKSFEKIQRRMFGKVYSRRAVSQASQWELLVLNLKGAV